MNLLKSKEEDSRDDYEGTGKEEYSRLMTHH